MLVLKINKRYMINYTKSNTHTPETNSLFFKEFIQQLPLSWQKKSDLALANVQPFLQVLYIFFVTFVKIGTALAKIRCILLSVKIVTTI